MSETNPPKIAFASFIVSSITFKMSGKGIVSACRNMMFFGFVARAWTPAFICRDRPRLPRTTFTLYFSAILPVLSVESPTATTTSEGRGRNACICTSKSSIFSSSFSAGMTIAQSLVFLFSICSRLFCCSPSFSSMVLVFTYVGSCNLPSADTTPCLKSKTMRRNLNKLLNLLLSSSSLLSRLFLPSLPPNQLPPPPPPPSLPPLLSLVPSPISITTGSNDDDDDATDADGDEDDDARVDVLSLFRSSSFLFFFSSRSFLKKEEKLTTNNVITTIFLRSRWF
mmetsp:Transcript_2358/g.7215  ORF Transcript_2358/g.7215 Transcript_2358/m.7215 type:complete len:282 (+) Transcript_2358:3480-4325(+)